MNQSKLATKLNLIYITIYGALACFYPFLVYYFQQKQLSYAEMGIGFAIVSITSVIFQPIWGFITDKYSNKRTIIIITMLLTSLSIYSLIFANGFYFIIASLILVMIFQSPVAPIADAYSYEIIEKYKHLQYGKIRLMGSLGYAVAALLLGYIVKYFGINSSYFIYSLGMLLGVSLVFSIDYKSKSTQQRIRFDDILALISEKKFSLLLLSIITATIAIGSNNSYIPILIEKTGGDVAELGIVWFIIAISELPAFFFASKLIEKYGDLNLYMLGMVLYALRFFLNSVFDFYIPILVIQLLQGVTYTLYLSASLQYLNRITPAAMRTSAITLHAASAGVGGVIGNMGGGMLLEHISIFALYQLLAVMCIICFGLLMVLKNVTSSQNKEVSIAEPGCL